MQIIEDCVIAVISKGKRNTLSQDAKQHINQLEGEKKLTAAFCLRGDEGKPLFVWFDLTPDEKKNLKAALKDVFHKDVEIDLERL